MTSYNPQKTRIKLLNADPEQGILVSIYYPKPNRIDVYKKPESVKTAAVYISPTNADYSGGKVKFLEPKENEPADKYIPDVSEMSGSNWFDMRTNLIHVVVKGGDVIDLVEAPFIQVYCEEYLNVCGGFGLILNTMGKFLKKSRKIT